MNKRRAARELALIAFSQLSKSLKTSENVNFPEIIHKSAEMLTTEAESTLDSAVQELSKIRDYVLQYEIEHPDNLERPIEVSTVPVQIPMTSDMLGRIDMLLEAVEKTYTAIDLTRLSSFEELDDVKNYALRLLKTYFDNKTEIDNKIKEHLKGWEVDRLVKIDRDILRIAITEICYIDEVPKGVAIDEAVEIAKKYGSEESSKFINGLLGQVNNV